MKGRKGSLEEGEGSERLPGGRGRIVLELEESQGRSKDQNHVSENTYICLEVGVL